MVSHEPLSAPFSHGSIRVPPIQRGAVPFPKFTENGADGTRGFVQFWPERDCSVSHRFFRALDPYAHARWWLREVVTRTGHQVEYSDNFIARGVLERSITPPCFRSKVMGALEVVPELEHLRGAAHSFGYSEFGAMGTFVRCCAPSACDYASGVSLSERCGKPREALGRIPDLYDPVIFFEHTPTQSPFATTARMRAEGEQDAECVRHYLAAYQRFMDSPNVENLVNATLSPYFGDSYYLAMKWCLTNNVSEDFISLLHVTFSVQWVVGSRPLGGALPPYESRGLFREDVELLGAAVRRYCQGEKASASD